MSVITSAEARMRADYHAWLRAADQFKPGEPPPNLKGYAARYESWTTLYSAPGYEVREILRRGAFRNALARGDLDVRALVNHDPNQVLGRSTSGTLKVWEDDDGLAVDIRPPDTSLGRDVATLVAREDMSQMSFAFLPIDDSAEKTTIRESPGMTLVEIEVFDVGRLLDVSIVTFPAYRDTSIGLRSGDGARILRKAFVAQKRAELAALTRRSPKA